MTTKSDGVRVSLLDARNASEKIREKYEAKIFELNTLNNDRGVVIENYAKDIARMQIVMDGLKEREKNLTGYKDLFLVERRKTSRLQKDQNVMDGQIATQRKVIKEAKDAVEESLKRPLMACIARSRHSRASP